MSTIEEAREQARAAAEIVEHRLAGRWLGGSLVREADKDVPALRTSLHALRTLLDATEPRPITDEMVEAGAKALNNAGWTYEGADEPGCWCEDCQAVCIPPARAILEAAEEARR